MDDEIEPSSPSEPPEPPTEPVVSPVTFNATKHGIFSVSPVVPWFETEDDWLEFRDSIFESLQPDGGLQMALADRAAGLLWRMMRLVRYERENVTADLLRVGTDAKIAAHFGGEEWSGELTPRLKEQMNRMALRRLVPDEGTLNKIMRYEGRLHRHLLQTLHQLSVLQGLRPKGGRTTMGLRDLNPPRAP